MRVGIIGCGYNSSYHIGFARSYKGAMIVGIADTDNTRSGECAAKYNIPASFSNVRDLVAEANPDVIHIVTPPRSHYAVAKEAMELKRHVLVEKPLALNTEEASGLYALAEKNNVRLCAMHNHLFDPCMVKAGDLVRRGVTGEIVGVEVYYGLNTLIKAFREYPFPNTIPWIYELPGSVYHDLMPHLLYVALPYTGKLLSMEVAARSCGILPARLPDEIRILLNGEKAQGVLTLSFSARPHLHYIRLFGKKGVVDSNIDTMTTVFHAANRLPKAIQKAAFNLSEGWQIYGATVSNAIGLLTGRLEPYQGMKALIHSFYDSIKSGGETPVKRTDALHVIETMDRLWEKLRLKPPDFSPIMPHAPYPLRHKEKILVTGGTGFIGKRIAGLLVREGYPVRVLARKLSNIEPLEKLGVEIFFGDVADNESLKSAFDGIDVVVHAAAGTSPDKKDGLISTVKGTANIMELSEERGIKKIVYISTVGVYNVVNSAPGGTITEESRLEGFPSGKGYYSQAKSQAEDIVKGSMKNGSTPVVILRPGIVFGPGGDTLNQMIGARMAGNIFIVIENGCSGLPFVYVDDLADAVLLSIRDKAADNEIFNVVSGEKIDKRQYMNKFVKKLFPHSLVLYLPYTVVYLAVWAQEALLALMKREPYLSRYKLVSSQKNVRYDGSKIARMLKWRPAHSFDEAVKTTCRGE